jgi:hypothetical protein
VSLISARTWRFLVFSQGPQQLPEPLLSTASCATRSTLSTEIHQFGDAFPARTSGCGIITGSKELLRFFPGRGYVLLLLAVVVLIEIIDISLCGFDGLRLTALRGCRTVGKCKIAVFAPLLDDFWLFLGFAICRSAGGEWRCRASYSATRCDML